MFAWKNRDDRFYPANKTCFSKSPRITAIPETWDTTAHGILGSVKAGLRFLWKI
jgi:hypothetical protein